MCGKAVINMMCQRTVEVLEQTYCFFHSASKVKIHFTIQVSFCECIVCRDFLQVATVQFLKETHDVAMHQP